MSKDGFLERWSRRKLAAGKPDEAEPRLDEAPEEAAPVAKAPVEETLDEAELAQLPSLDSFTLKTDLAPFLRKGVPHALRNAALRKMWMLDPAIRDHKDFAVDYAWDWNTPGGVPGNAGTLSHDSVRRMLDSLNPKPKEPETARIERAEEAPDAGEHLATAAPEMRPHSHPPASMPQATPDHGASDAPDPAPASERMSRPRRHGGAAPV